MNNKQTLGFKQYSESTCLHSIIVTWYVCKYNKIIPVQDEREMD